MLRRAPANREAAYVRRRCAGKPGRLWCRPLEARCPDRVVSIAALLEPFLASGYGAARYTGEKDLLRERIWRIRSLVCRAASMDGAYAGE